MNIVDVKQFTDYDGKRQYVWQTLQELQAMRLAEPRLRCSECYGAVGCLQLLQTARCLLMLNTGGRTKTALFAIAMTEAASVSTH